LGNCSPGTVKFLPQHLPNS